MKGLAWLDKRLDPSWLPVAIIVILCLVATCRTRHYATVWQSESSVWAHAVEMAPKKPRPMMWRGVMLRRSGERDEALRAFLSAIMLTRQRHVPAWDRRDVFRAASANLEEMTVMSLMEATKP